MQFLYFKENSVGWILLDASDVTFQFIGSCGRLKCVTLVRQEPVGRGAGCQ